MSSCLTVIPVQGEAKTCATLFAGTMMLKFTPRRREQKMVCSRKKATCKPCRSRLSIPTPTARVFIGSRYKLSAQRARRIRALHCIQYRSRSSMPGSCEYPTSDAMRVSLFHSSLWWRLAVNKHYLHQGSSRYWRQGKVPR